MVITVSFARRGIAASPSLLRITQSCVQSLYTEIEFARCRMWPRIVGRVAAEADKSVNNKSDWRHVEGRSLRDNSDKGGRGGE